MATPVGLSGSSSVTLEAAEYPGRYPIDVLPRIPLAIVRHRSLITGFRPASNLSEASPGR